jgi:hypothetical protein
VDNIKGICDERALLFGAFLRKDTIKILSERCGLVPSLSGYGPVAVPSEHDKEPEDSMEDE